MRAKTKLTRLCSILLTLVLLVGMLPTVALAAEPATGTADFTSDGNPTDALTLLNTYKTGAADSTDNPNIAAVSALSIVGPKLAGCATFSRAASSSGVKSPSGPTKSP